MFYNFGFSLQLPIKDLLGAFFYGIKLDISITGYLLLLLSVLMVFLTFAGHRVVKWVTRIYNLVFVTLFSIITIVDIELYRNWGFRVDSTILLYLKTPQEGLASTRIGLLILLVAATGLFIWIFLRVYKKYVESTLINTKPLKWYFAPLFLLLAGTMIIPVRGGFGIAPINVGTVFFSHHQFANHAAVNCIWNFGESLSNRNKKQEIVFMENSLANREFSKLFTFNDDKPTFSLIKNEKPNILIIILESFANVVIEPLGGLPDVTPQLSKIADEGVLFTNFYANGDRSDKGIVSILSGYPAQPTTSIIKFTSKSEKLPHISKELIKLGYSTGFYYGGEINFANMKSYFVGGAYETLVTLDDFSDDDLNSKWGAHDHIVFNRRLNDLEQTQQHIFRAIFTLISHEPFDVPHLSKYNGMDDESK
jgi:phosphoglycerol transferase MdoB-like AlkP superfamily enzyme